MKRTKTIKSIKGFNEKLQCRGFQYEIGNKYTLPKGEEVSICKRGFHAISEDCSPLEVFGYYPPSIDGKPSRYCEVELGGQIQNDGEKIAGSQIKIGAEIGIPGLVKAHIEWVKRNLIQDDEHKTSNTGNRSSASNTGDYSSASNTGDYSSASNTGDYSSASNTGYQSSASNTGNRSSASNTGDYSSASNTGYQSSASNTGDYSSASNTGDYSSASNTGYQSSASNTGNRSSAEVSGKDSVAAVFGKDGKARGSIGCALFLTERGEWNGETYPIKNVMAVIVDGEKVKADTWYKLIDGKLVEADNDK